MLGRLVSAGFDLLEHFVGPFPESATMSVATDPNEITQQLPVRAIDTVLEHNYDKAAVRQEHAVHTAALNGFAVAAAEAQQRGRTDLASWYRKQAAAMDADAAIRLRATAARAS